MEGAVSVDDLWGMHQHMKWLSLLEVTPFFL